MNKIVVVFALAFAVNMASYAGGDDKKSKNNKTNTTVTSHKCSEECKKSGKCSTEGKACGHTQEQGNAGNKGSCCQSKKEGTTGGGCSGHGH